ncbi:helix-turn-helix domain-containing protein [Arthrobacter deserti]|uniref:Helix-turn-helix domain-containing protein n=1 Tax=Arthrobacter deserti TaxID=1742687 RepID=A0ABX1JR94_9MICC|nr:helix-turn-helix domain-containing protein [Arthrobacter deserti]
MTPEQVADKFGVSVRSVREKCRAQKWPHGRLDSRTVRFTPQDI